MRKLVQGVHQFQQEVFGNQKELFKRLADNQQPHTLFITCSDSRINPNLLTQTVPGEIFILRNAGNIVPAYNALIGGEAASIEFAINGLGIEHIVVCGHSNCGAMKAIVSPAVSEPFPALKQWLSYSGVKHEILMNYYKEYDQESLLNVAIQENVLAQLENLRTHPAVSGKLAQGKLHLYAWVYKIHTGEVFSYNPNIEQFDPVSEVHSQPPRYESAKKRDVITI